MEIARQRLAPSTRYRKFGPTALITGASDGIGRAFAEALAAEGFDLILVARREAALRDLGAALSGRFGVTARVLSADLSAPGAVPWLLSETVEEHIGLLVAAAGFGSIGAFLERDLAAELNMVDLNCRAIVELAHGFGRRMAVQRRGGMILFSSVVGFQGVPLSATYAATKGFIQSFAEAMAAEWRPQGVSVLSVAPGPVGSGFAARAGMTMGRAATPDGVTRGALAALGRTVTVRPGLLSKALGWSLATLPRGMRVWIMGRIMQSMAPLSAPQPAVAESRT